MTRQFGINIRRIGIKLWYSNINQGPLNVIYNFISIRRFKIYALLLFCLSVNFFFVWHHTLYIKVSTIITCCSHYRNVDIVMYTINTYILQLSMILVFVFGVHSYTQAGTWMREETQIVYIWIECCCWHIRRNKVCV